MSGFAEADRMAVSILEWVLGFRLKSGTDLPCAIAHLVNREHHVIAVPLHDMEEAATALPTAARATRARYAVIVVEVWMRRLDGLSSKEAQAVVQRFETGEAEVAVEGKSALFAILEHPSGLSAFTVDIHPGAVPERVQPGSSMIGVYRNLSGLGPPSPHGLQAEAEAEA